MQKLMNGDRAQSERGFGRMRMNFQKLLRTCKHSYPLALGLFVALSAAAAHKFSPPTREAMAVIVENAAKEPSLVKRLKMVSEPFIGAPYQNSPLGEGDAQGPDGDPLIRFDAFDCTTFVETVMAMAMTSTLTEAERVLLTIRYRESEVTFLKRRHFPEAEWIPELSRGAERHDAAGWQTWA